MTNSLHPGWRLLRRKTTSLLLRAVCDSGLYALVLRTASSFRDVRVRVAKRLREAGAPFAPFLLYSPTLRIKTTTLSFAKGAFVAQWESCIFEETACRILNAQASLKTERSRAHGGIKHSFPLLHPSFYEEIA